MSLSVVLAAVSLVLAGLLFGFNIQINESIIDVISSLGTLVSAIAAATAALFSYKSIGQWRNQVEHSLLYNHFSDLERLLITYNTNIRRDTFDDNLTDVLRVFRIPVESASDIRQDYENTYQKICEIAPESMLPKLKSIQIDTLIEMFSNTILDYKSTINSINEYMRTHQDEVEKKSIDELPELFELAKRSTLQGWKVHNICDQSLKTLRELRSTL